MRKLLFLLLVLFLVSCRPIYIVVIEQECPEVEFYKNDPWFDNIEVKDIPPVWKLGNDFYQVFPYSDTVWFKEKSGLKLPPRWLNIK